MPAAHLHDIRLQKDQAAGCQAPVDCFYQLGLHHSPLLVFLLEVGIWELQVTGCLKG